MQKKLQLQELNHPCTKTTFPFQTTADLPSGTGLVSHEGHDALSFALQIKTGNPHIYVAWEPKYQQKDYVVSIVKSFAKNIPQSKAPNSLTAFDWCYVHNFKHPTAPKAFRFPPKTGRQFKEDMQKLLLEIMYAMEDTFFHQPKYEEYCQKIDLEFDQKREEVLEEITALASDFGFQLEESSESIFFIPTIDGVAVPEKDYDNLPETMQKEIENQASILEEKVVPLLEKIQLYQAKKQKMVASLMEETTANTIYPSILSMERTYAKFPHIVEYLTEVERDIIENMHTFIFGDSAEMDLQFERGELAFLRNYTVHLLVEQKEADCLPVVVADHLSPSKLLGEIVYEPTETGVTTHFTKIKAGLLHQANGGMLLLSMQSLLSDAKCYEILMGVLQMGVIDFSQFYEMSSTSLALPTIQAEPIPFRGKIILMGDVAYYYGLRNFDEVFAKQFPLKIAFEKEIPNTKPYLMELARFVKGFVEREETLDFHVLSICTLAEYANRLSGKRGKLTTAVETLEAILSEAVTWAEIDGADFVLQKHMETAIKMRSERNGSAKKQLQNHLKDGTILIETDGASVGQINGLSVISTVEGEKFGMVCRLTATTYMGKDGVINIEREVNLSGDIHNKGLQIIAGWIGQTYGQRFPLSFSCSICFEQNYSGIDGDSASSTELYCILSSLSELPIRQDIAVTGSVNQKGEIQGVGGVSHKIEGFFALCQAKGLTGKQGVLIPKINVKDLILSAEVRTAVEHGVFHIYPISRIEEGLEVLLDCEVDVIHEKVMGKLQKFHEQGNVGN
ncbi:MAG: ATP-binding protein [Bacillota bacterium]